MGGSSLVCLGSRMASFTCRGPRTAIAILVAIGQPGCRETGDAGEVDASSTNDPEDTGEATHGEATHGEDSTGDEPSVGWTEVFAAGPELGMLMSVWGTAPDDLVVVGGQQRADGGSDAAMVVHDGMQWQPVALPPGTPWLNWVFGVDGEVWSVGRGGTVLRRRGETWSTIETPTELELWGVWGDSSTSLWVVGGEPIQGPPIMMRWEGDAFSIVDTSFLPEEVRALFKVWGRSANEVYVVGDMGAVAVYDGEAWTMRTNESIAPLFAIWGAEDGAVVTAGGRANARVAHVLETAVEGTTSELPGLSGVWVDASGLATVVGDLGTIARVAPGTLTLEPEVAPTHHLLHATFGFEGGPRFAVGGSFHDPPPKVGIVLRADD